MLKHSPTPLMKSVSPLLYLLGSVPGQPVSQGSQSVSQQQRSLLLIICNHAFVNTRAPARGVNSKVRSGNWIGSASNSTAERGQTVRARQIENAASYSSRRAKLKNEERLEINEQNVFR